MQSEEDEGRHKRKNTNSHVGPRRVNSFDDLSVMSDEELSFLYTDINSQRNDLMKRHNDAVCHEVELAYIQREMKVRSVRRIEHRRYNDKINKEIADFYAVDALLPEFVPNPPMEFN